MSDKFESPKEPVLVSATPNWGENYAPGFIGFTYYDKNLVSLGIAWFSRSGFLAMSKHPVSHTFVVSGANECIEAQPGGVVRSDLMKYFSDPHCHVYFKKPVNYDTEMGKQIVQCAEYHLGDKYNFGLIWANVAAKCLAGRFLNFITRNRWTRLLCWAVNSKHLEICSTVVAQALLCPADLKGLGVLKQPVETITPEDLRDDWTVFERWQMLC